MGNFLFTERGGSSRTTAESDDAYGDAAVFAPNMYNGPLNHGDPNHRGLRKMESETLIPNRMREIIHEVHCRELSNKMKECVKEKGSFMGVYRCDEAFKEVSDCAAKFFKDEELLQAVTNEYLDERSHFRQSGIKTERYDRKKWIPRDVINDPPLDENNKYIPRKPTGWDNAYKESGPPPWASERYHREYKQSQNEKESTS